VAILVAHTVPVIAFCMLGRKEAYYDLGGDYFDRLKAEGLSGSLVKHFERRDHKVHSNPSPRQPRYFRTRLRGLHPQLADVRPEREIPDVMLQRPKLKWSILLNDF
jgi:hypothetical protein